MAKPAERVTESIEMISITPQMQKIVSGWEAAAQKIERILRLRPKGVLDDPKPSG